MHNATRPTVQVESAAQVQGRDELLALGLYGGSLLRVSPVDLEGLASGPFGLVDFASSDVNLGQLIQTFAALRVVPTESFLVDRERLSDSRSAAG